MKILNRYTQEVIWKSRCSTMRETVIKALESKISLSQANLSKANLYRANLSWANLSEANLSEACLSQASFYRANLSEANLSQANLSEANLSQANLSEAYLSEACLSQASFYRANLSQANLSIIRADFISEVIKLPNELEFLKDAIINGQIDGSQYAGECACLAGTLAHAKGIENYRGQPIKNGCEFKANSDSPREIFFLGIRKGDKPETNQISQIVLDWTNEAILIRDNIRAIH